MTEKNYRSLDEVETEYFRQHPDEIDAYIDEIFEEYAVAGDTAALLASLRIIAKVKGVSEIASQIGITRQGLQKALSSKGNPGLEDIKEAPRMNRKTASTRQSQCSAVTAMHSEP